MPLDTTNFHPQGPVKSVDMLQFYNLFTGVMTDQPVTFSNTLTLGGNQNVSTVPLRVYGAVGQNTNLIDLYSDKSQAQPGFGFSAAGRFGWGPGGASPQDTFMSRIATQNGHATDTPGLFITPALEIAGTFSATGNVSSGGAISATGNITAGGTISALGYNFTNGATLTGPAGSPNQITITQDLRVSRNVYLGATGNARVYLQGGVGLMLEQPDATLWGILQAKYVVALSSNAYSDGANWQRWDTAQPSVQLIAGASGNTTIQCAAAGANPISTWLTSFTTDSAGNIALGGTFITFNTRATAIAMYYSASDQLFHFQGSGIMANGPFYFNSNASLYLSWNSGASSIYSSQSFMIGANNYYFYNNPGIWVGWNTNGWIGTSHQILVNGPVMFGGSTSASLNWDGAYIRLNGGAVLMPTHLGLTTGSQLLFRYDAYTPASGPSIRAAADDRLITRSNGTVDHLNNTDAAYVAVRASAFTVSSIRKNKSNITALPNPIGVVLDPDLYGIEFDYVDGSHKVGFIADEWEDKVPGLMSHDTDGALMGMDYGAVGAITFQALKEYILRTDAKIAELERRLAA